MARKGSEEAVEVSPGLVRSKDQIQLFDNFVVNNTTEQISDGVNCWEYREFLLYLELDSTNTPTTLQIKLQYRERWSSNWYTYKQGLFASLFYEDTDVASIIRECFSGPVLGREIRITLTGVGTTGSATFTVSAALEFRN